MEVKITAMGHPNIRATHHTTWQLTTEEHLSTRGDCIIAINSSHAAKNLPQPLKKHIQQGGKLKIKIIGDGFEYHGVGRGHPDLDLTHNTDMVFRRSEYTCNRTVTINTTFTAKDLPRELISYLQNPRAEVTIRLIPITPNMDE